MIRLTCCHRANHAGEYFRLQLADGDAPAAPIQVPPALQARWVGSALAQVGLDPLISPTALHLVRLARGRHPVEKIQLAPVVNRTRAYYDLMIAAPKTVSLAALLQPDHPTARRVTKAHVLAVHRVAAEVSQWMLRGQSQSAPKPAQWLGVIFGHTHTREGDPHLHSHLVIPNLMLARTGEWRALQIDIGGSNRLRLGLLYAHELSRHLRRAGLGAELALSPQATPELRSLRPLAQTFSSARRKVLQAAQAAEAGRPAEAPRPAVTAGGGTLPDYPEHPDRAALRRRQQLADQLRRHKPRLADDPISLECEARRWTGALTRAQRLTLQRVLASGGVETDPRAPGLAIPPSLHAAFIRDACQQIPEDTRRTGLVVFQATVRASAGRHAWEELRQVCRAYLDARQKRWQQMRGAVDEQAVRTEHARIARIATSARPSVIAPVITPSPPPTEPARRPSRRRGR